MLYVVQQNYLAPPRSPRCGVAWCAPAPLDASGQELPPERATPKPIQTSHKRGLRRHRDDPSSINLLPERSRVVGQGEVREGRTD